MTSSIFCAVRLGMLPGLPYKGNIKLAGEMWAMERENRSIILSFPSFFPQRNGKKTFCSIDKVSLICQVNEELQIFQLLFFLVKDHNVRKISK